MNKILFICTKNSCRSQLAEAFALARNEKGIKIVSAGTETAEVHPLAIKVMAETGIDISGQKSKSLNDLPSLDFDVVISLCDQAAKNCPLLPGNPERVNWNLPDPAAEVSNNNLEGEAALDVFRQTRDVIKRLVNDFFERGYLVALMEAKRGRDIVINNISDGIIAHDLNRRVFYFNKAAEEITGYRREDVINRDCHEVFPGRFCGGKCHFCDGALPITGDIIKQEISFATKDGERRSLDMTIKKMVDANENTVGVLASFKDVTRELQLAERAGAINSFAGIVGRDGRMLEVFELIRDLADSSAPVLIQGESGTGKELVAAAIHNEGMRANKLFVAVNCGALPEFLLESELFGHVKGAFTGAIRDKKGRFEIADGGTIFLDEIGDVPPAMQMRLLRVLQEGTFERVGSEKTVKVDVRLISATNKDLGKEMAEGRFREDLFYRINVVPVKLPPLRERRNDIPALVENILKRALNNSGKSGIEVSSDALDVMMSYNWPGNIRELQNWIQFALVRCKGPVIKPEHLPPGAGITRSSDNILTGKKLRGKLDAASVISILKEVNDNRAEAARRLGVSRATLYRFLNTIGKV